MQRQLMDELIAWKSRANRKPLLLKGARQTGKTWLLNEFAGQQYQNVIRFDFMLEPGARSLFDGSLDPKRIISPDRAPARPDHNADRHAHHLRRNPRGTAWHHLAQILQRAGAGIPYRGSRLLYGARAPTRKRVVPPSARSTSSPCAPWGLSSSFVPSMAIHSQMPSLPQTWTCWTNVSEKLERLLKEYLVVGGMPEVVSAFATSPRFHRGPQASAANHRSL